MICVYAHKWRKLNKHEALKENLGRRSFGHAESFFEGLADRSRFRIVNLLLRS